MLYDTSQSTTTRILAVDDSATIRKALALIVEPA
jgi:hypothetical protein